ncbi:UNVERIFIED_CONTAM: hypothetical protein Slati_2354200 [Sesamum latifolium]|uniref:Uncharacterized protein n=1 Tax=Sesamum latifolium TaxID=2727402 RepID=A0AAW2WAS3_9LAMI
MSLKSNKFSWISNIDPPMLILKPHFPRNLPAPLHLYLPLLRQPTEPLQPLFHVVVHLPPPLVRGVARVDPLIRHIPVAVVVPVALPWLQPQVMQRVQLRRVRPEQLVLHARLDRGIRPEVLQEVDPPRQPLPPHEHLVQEPLIAARCRRRSFLRFISMRKVQLEGSITITPELKMEPSLPVADICGKWKRMSRLRKTTTSESMKMTLS